MRSDDQRSPQPRPVLPDVAAARAEPRLRRLFPRTSHYDPHFSLSASSPRVHEGLPHARTREDGRYLVGRWHEPGAPDTATTPEEAVALLVDRLPPDLGPLFNHPEDGPR
ncbi:DUF6193 family natural product biosynthesis protein [Kitasatospora sp. NPDC005856]|uniref:DUF6193 family natural product biosynthesis protein n=1 Tax=Kitasatospora sp. NPDC005856 TaxID=3154566 RepID=UPI0033DB1290